MKESHSFEFSITHKGWTVYKSNRNAHYYATKPNRTSQTADTLDEIWNLIHAEDKSFREKNIPKECKAFIWDWRSGTYKAILVTGIDRRYNHLLWATVDGQTQPQRAEEIYPLTPENVAAINKIEALEKEIREEKKKLTTFDKTYFDEKVVCTAELTCCDSSDKSQEK